MTEEENNPDTYQFKNEERVFVSILEKSIRNVLAREGLPAKDVHSCAIMLFAIQRLPLVTDGVALELSLVSKCATGSGFLYLKIDEESLELGSYDTYDAPYGSDTESAKYFEVGVGRRWKENDYVNAEDWASEFCQRAKNQNIEVRFDVFSDSEPDWTADNNVDRYWDELDSDFA